MSGNAEGSKNPWSMEDCDADLSPYNFTTTHFPAERFLEAHLSPCNFATTHVTACNLSFYLFFASRPIEWSIGGPFRNAP